MNRRPAGVIICAILLALASAFLLLCAALSGFAAIVAPHVPAPTTPGATPPPPGLLLGVMLFSIVFYLALSAWAGTTSVGLFRLRPWARISVIVFGSALIVAGLFGCVSMFAVQLAAGTMPLPPGTDAHMLHVVFAGMGIMALLLAGIGIWWVVYFALRRTKNAFVPSAPPESTPHPATLDYFNHAEVQSNPTTYVENPLGYSQVPERMLDAGTPSWSSVPSKRSGRPISITVIAILLLIASFSSLLQMFSPFPLFLFGIALSGWPAHITMLVWCAVNGVSGLGLLKREKPAWMLALGIFSLPALNALLMLLPGSRLRFAAYMQTLMERSSFGLPQPQVPPQFLASIMVLGVLLAFAVSAVLLTLLWRARWAFENNADEDQAAR